MSDPRGDGESQTDESQTEGGPQAEPELSDELVCDFCGETTSNVRRVALDGSYERLRTPHRAQFACPDCSERKDRDRVGSQGS